jgi:dTDP-4-dehydrorhamnose reductase
MRVLIAGSLGQLGNELCASVPEGVEVLAIDRAEVDITDRDAVYRYIQTAMPAVIINAAAYTAVDKAESERDLAYAVNADGAENLALAAARIKARLIHISTDFIFDGKQSHPYRPQDEARPLSVYGSSKLDGETAVLKACPGAVIIRTAWVYSCFGANFVKTMLKLMAEREQLNVVSDQVGSPTWAAGLAALVWRFVAMQGSKGIYHWSDAGVASWYDFAVAIHEEATALGLLTKACTIRPILTQEYPTPAARPAYSVLDKSACWQVSKLEPVHWRVSLRAMLAQMSRA